VTNSSSPSTNLSDNLPRLSADFDGKHYSEVRPFYDLGKELKKLTLNLLSGILKEIEPNWAELNLVFNTDQTGHELEAAHLNGPKQGTTDILALLQERVPRSVLYLLRAHAVVGEQWGHRPFCRRFTNPKYVFEFVPDRTELCLSDGDEEGYVLSVEDGKANLLTWSNWPGRSDRESRETVSCSQLQGSIRGERDYDYTSVRYLNPGQSASKAHEEDVANERREQEEYERQHPETAAQPSTSEEPPNTDKGEAAKDDRFAAQATIIHALMPFLPGPSRG